MNSDKTRGISSKVNGRTEIDFELSRVVLLEQGV